MEEKLTNARMKVLEDIVDFKEVTVDDSIEEDISKKQEYAQESRSLWQDCAGKKDDG